ncbi:MAG: type I restriction enzyme HsdR N-terminal domain-containing protein [Bacteroidales bacterium]|nr:type I restriction enzyme HsdR N-terminal domain-containing protein [Bacteroidales bacterium]
MPSNLFPQLNLPPAELTIRHPADGAGRPTVLCLSRRRFVALTPEEWVRQHFLAHMISNLGYPPGLVQAEAPVRIGSSRQRADIVAFSRQMEPLVIVECKAPQVQLSQLTLNQACRYLSVLSARAVVLTNGLSHYCVTISPGNSAPHFAHSLPTWQDIYTNTL